MIASASKFFLASTYQFSYSMAAYLSFYEAWATSVEDSLRVADERGWGQETSLPQLEYALILKSLAHCEEGVRRLAMGDKRVFKFDANGEFAMAQRMLTHWEQMLDRIETGDNYINEHTPLWASFCKAVTLLCDAWRECGPHVLELRFFEDPARTAYGKWLQDELKTMSFPSQLAAVPDPIDNLFVRTGGMTPCSGIWEPIDVAKIPKTSLLSFFSRTPDPQPPFQICGAMNYLHGGSNAPQIKVETSDDNHEFDTTWRLIWRDDRYLDGSIPAIEAQYVFTQPATMVEERPRVWSNDEVVWAETGSRAAFGGRWLVESDLNAAVTLQQGDKFPMHEGREVRWVLAGK
jgi:hypothetical protein